MLKATKPGHQPVEQWVRIRAGRRISITLLLDREITTGSINISSTPATAAWYLDGDYMGRTPDEAQGIETGRYEIEVKKPGYKPWRRSVPVEKAKRTEINARLEAEQIEYALAVETEPKDARVRILNIGPRYYSGIRLQPGQYHVEVSKQGYETHKQWIEIATADRVVEVTLRRRPGSGRDRVWVDPETGMEFVWVPGGCYQMGSTAGDSDEKPVHEVCVDGFWLGKYEVTVGEFRRFVGAKGYRTEAERGEGCYTWDGKEWDYKKDKDWRDPGFSQEEKSPVVCVSWNDVMAYTKWVSKRTGRGYRLASEAEWEYACRSGGKQQKYCGGDDIKRLAWYCENSGDKTRPVGGKEPNSLGLYDMSGNVWEWVADWYAEDYYSKSPKHNPKGPGRGAYRVNRGGGWIINPAGVRAAYGGRYTPGDRDDDLGFRLLRTGP